MAAVFRDADVAAVIGAHNRARRPPRVVRGPHYSRRLLMSVVTLLMSDPGREWAGSEVATLIETGRTSVDLIVADLVAAGHLTRRRDAFRGRYLYRLTEVGIATYRPDADPPSVPTPPLVPPTSWRTP